MTVVPLPRKASSTMSPRTEQSRMASATIAAGLTVGWSTHRLPSSPQRPKELAPGYCQILLRFRPNRPSWILLRCVRCPCLKTRTSGPPDVLKGFERLAVRVQSLAPTAREADGPLRDPRHKGSDRHNC